MLCWAAVPKHHDDWLNPSHAPLAATEAELQELFEQYGSVTEVHLVLDRCAAWAAAGLQLMLDPSACLVKDAITGLSGAVQLSALRHRVRHRAGPQGEPETHGLPCALQCTALPGSLPRRAIEETRGHASPSTVFAA